MSTFQHDDLIDIRDLAKLASDAQSDLNLYCDWDDEEDREVFDVEAGADDYYDAHELAVILGDFVAEMGYANDVPEEDLSNALKLRDVLEEISGNLDSIASREGSTLIAEEYFETYAQDYAESTGAISSENQWPLSYIDWDAAADALKQDYTSVELDGTTYYLGS